MTNIKDVPSVLRMESLYFENFSFIKDSSIDDSTHGIRLDVSDNVIDTDSFEIKIILQILSEENYSLTLSLCGLFSIKGGLNAGNSFLKENAVAIMFPYLRSEVTLLTTQPGISPVVLPPVNVKALMRSNKKPVYKKFEEESQVDRSASSQYTHQR